MSIWRQEPILDQLNGASQGSLAGHLDIEFTDFGDDYLIARMPVNERTRQPFGLLHGGASASLAETLGSVAGLLTLNGETHFVVGIALNINHMRAVREGFVQATTRPLHLGRTTQVWQIDLEDEAGRLVAASRLTLAVRAHRREDPGGNRVGRPGRS